MYENVHNLNGAVCISKQSIPFHYLIQEDSQFHYFNIIATPQYHRMVRYLRKGVCVKSKPDSYLSSCTDVGELLDCYCNAPS